jgi:Fic family protein
MKLSMNNDKIFQAIFHKCEPFYSEFKNVITYHSSKIEGSSLSLEDNKALISDTNAKGKLMQMHEAKFVIENQQLLEVFDFIVDTYDEPLTHNYIKKLHQILCSQSPDLAMRKEIAGDYRQKDVHVGGMPGARPQYVYKLIDQLLKKFPKEDALSLKDIAEFHAEYEVIHPFYDGNGRTGRMIAFKQCLQSGNIPFIVTEENKEKYYNGIAVARSSYNYEHLSKFFEVSQILTEELFKEFGCNNSKQQKLS